MNIIDTINYGRSRQALGTEAALSLLVPVATTGLIVSIGDVLRNGKAVSQQKFFNSAAKKIRLAVMRANREGSVPQIALEEEEAGVLNAVVTACKFGVSSVVESFVGALFTFIPAAIEAVVVPMFTIASWTVMTALPLLLTPEGMIAIGALGALGLVGYLYKRWKSGDKSDLLISQQTPLALQGNAAEVPLTSGASRGLRNNNPGNLEYAGQPYSLPKTGRFAQFATQGQGLYNVGRQVELYYSRGLDTVTKIVSTYAPRSDNDTASYIADVAHRLGVDPNAKLDLSKQEVLASLISAIVWRENGSNPYTQAQIDEAAGQAIGFARNGYKDVAPSELVSPVSGVVTSPFGHRGFVTEGATTEHMGIDIGAPVGTPVYAAADGEIEIAGASAGYGNLVQVKHGSMWTRYGHLSKFDVSKGATVRAGQKIGEVGSTGVSTGSHLHFEVQPFGAKSPVDPATYLPGLQKGSRVAATGDHPAPMVAGSQDKTFINQDGKIIAIKEG